MGTEPDETRVSDQGLVNRAITITEALRDAAEAKAAKADRDSKNRLINRAAEAARLVTALTTLLETAAEPAALSDETLDGANVGLQTAGLVEVDLWEIEAVQAGKLEGPIRGTGVLDDLDEEAVNKLSKQLGYGQEVATPQEFDYTELMVALGGAAADIRAHRFTTLDI